MAKAADQFWNDAARKYASSPIADQAGYERSVERTRALLEGAQAVFEFGCGTGTTALKLAPSVARYVGSDISPEMIAIAREKAASEGVTNVEFVTAPADAAPWSAESFDAVLGFNILHLIPDRAATLAGVARVLKPGGLFISKTPCLKEMNPLIRLAVPLMQAIGKAPDVAFFGAADLEAEIARAGFEVIERARHGSKAKEARIYLVARKA